MSEEAGGFIDYFTDLSDPRCDKNKLHPMPELLFVTLCAVICGAEGWQDVEDFGHAKLAFLRRYLAYEHGIPSDDTLRRFFRAIDTDAFQQRFIQWVQDFQYLPPESVVAIDGKTSRGSFDGDKAPLHLVSAFASEARIVLGQQKVDDKSNEITAIPQLLEWLDLKGAIVTIDAMGCQHNIAGAICDQQGDYVLALKGNQGTLHEDVKRLFDNEARLKRTRTDTCETTDGGHGRIEIRRCMVTSDIDWLRRLHPAWAHLETVVKIERIRDLQGIETCEESYYISSLPARADRLLQAIRSHWGIENSLHWILDMSFGEDQSRIRKHNAPHNMAVLRHVALNLLQKAKTKRQSIKRLRKMAGWDDQILEHILQQKLS